MKVFVRGLRIEAFIGLYAHERGRTQPLEVDVELTLAAEGVERLAQTVNYEDLARAASALAAEGHVDLVETYAERLAARCLEHPAALAVRVRVEKPYALKEAAAAGVEIVRVRPGNRPPTAAVPAPENEA